MLTPLVDLDQVSFWADPYIQVGDDWEREIRGVIATSPVALLLVSPEFLASRFIRDVELPALLERGARLVCVLVRDCLWERVPILRRVQWAHDARVEGSLAVAADRDGAVTK